MHLHNIILGVSIQLRLRLNNIQSCLEWISKSDVILKTNDMRLSILNSLNDQHPGLITDWYHEIQCDPFLIHYRSYRYRSYRYLPITCIFNTRFLCFSESQNHVTFRATLKLYQISAVEVVSYLQQWIDNISTLLIQGTHLELNKSCQLVIINLNGLECQTLDAITQAVPRPFCTVFAASTAVLTLLQVIIIITIVTIILCCVTIFKRYVMDVI